MSGVSTSLLEFPAKLERAAYEIERGTYEAAPVQGGERFAAGLEGHEKIERSALARLPDMNDAKLKAIYFGNWQRDVSQAIAPVVSAKLGPRAALVHELVFQVLDAMAERDFSGRRLDRMSLGTYRWEEHIDNPREYGIAIASGSYLPEAQWNDRTQRLEGNVNQFTVPDSFHVLWREDSRGRLGFLRAAASYVQMQLELALARSGAEGLAHFGNAMHTVEDFFSHSNFIELAFNFLGQTGGRQNGELLSGTYGREVPGVRGQPIKDCRGRLRLTTGVYLASDTAASIAKILVHRLEAPPADAKAERLNAILIDRVLPGGGAGAIYLRLVRLWKLTPIAQVQAKIAELITLPMKKAIAHLLHPLVAEGARFTGKQFKGFVHLEGGLREDVPINEVSHTQVARDNPGEPDHDLACDLAAKAVTEYFLEMERCWKGGITDYGSTRFHMMTDALFDHPSTNHAWWVPFFGPARTVPGSSPGFIGPPRPPAATGPAGLRRGARGPQVAQMQGKLNDWLRITPGSGLPLLVPDGVFGARTELAVRAFQRLRGLPMTGVIDARTAEALRAVPGSGRMQPSPSTPAPAGTPGAKFTANPNEVGTRRTTPTAREVVEMLRREWPELTENGARTLTAQFMGETGGGRFCFNWNLGNVKEPTGKLPHMYLRGVWEVLSPPAAQAHISRANGRARIASDAEVRTKGWSRPAGKVVAVFEPPHDACRFRAYASLRDGAQRWLGHHRRIAARNPGYLQAVSAGDTRAVAAALKRARYYTAGEEDYARLMARQKAVIDRTLG